MSHLVTWQGSAPRLTFRVLSVAIGPSWPLAKPVKSLRLPDARPGDSLAWSPEGANIPIARSLPQPSTTVLRKSRTVERATAPSQHPLVTGVKALFEGGRLSYDTGYLKPAKKLLVDLAVTKAGLDKALSFGNELFLALEDQGHRVLIAPNGEPFQRAEVDEHEKPRKNRGYSNLWSPGRCTVVYIGTIAIGLTIIEMSEEAEARYVNGQYVRLSEYVPPRRTPAFRRPMGGLLRGNIRPVVFACRHIPPTTPQSGFATGARKSRSR